MQATAIANKVKVVPSKVATVATVPVAKVKAVHHGVHLRLVVIHAMAWEHRQLRRSRVVIRFNPRNLRGHEAYYPSYSHASTSTPIRHAAAKAALEAPDMLDALFRICDTFIDAIKVSAMVLLALHVAHVDMTEDAYMRLGLIIAITYRLYSTSYRAYNNRAYLVELYREYQNRVQHGGMVK